MTYSDRDCGHTSPEAFADALEAMGVITTDAIREKIYTKLICAWEEPHRRYHSRTHLEFCLAKLWEYRLASCDSHFYGTDRDKNTALAEIALWYHDAVYRTDFLGRVNEDMSAVMALKDLLEVEAAQADIFEVYQAIYATKWPQLGTPLCKAEILNVVWGCELASLAGTYEDFQKWGSLIFEEYKVDKVTLNPHMKASIKRALVLSEIMEVNPFRGWFDRLRAPAEYNVRCLLRETLKRAEGFL
jgi:predicted metal-dependent HD superfamily phosphohydrolase